jgi:hypothetical protein
MRWGAITDGSAPLPGTEQDVSARGSAAAAIQLRAGKISPSTSKTVIVLTALTALTV